MNEQKYLGKLDIESPDVKKRLGKGPITTHISLFTGAGGLDCGFAMSGIQTRVMIEFDKSCCETLRQNFHWEELKKRTKEDGYPQWKSQKELINQSLTHRKKKNKLRRCKGLKEIKNAS